jgi:signal transduction histidine kinase
MTTTTAIETPAAPRRNRFWEYLSSAQLWRDTLYLLVLLPFSIVSFTLWVTGVSVTLSLIVFIVGFPIFVGFAMVNRGWSDVERRWAGLVLRERIGSRYRPHPKGLLPRVRSIAADPQTWRDFAWMLVDSIVGFAVSVGAVSIIASVLGMIAMPLWYWPLADGPDPVDFGVYQVTNIWLAFLTTAIGLALLPLFGWIIRGFALLHAQIAKALLSPSSAERVVELTETRAGAVDAAQEELNRIERDLHDGAQARLVALAMDLGMAEKKLLEDPETGRELIGEARTQALQTLSELRDLVRGIAPSILRDRGLSAALGSLTAGRQPTIELDVDVARRPSAAAEAAAYFVVAEAIANAGKHAPDARVRVGIREDDSLLYITVSDDGPGGAKVALGGGLDGLAKRVAALDGKLQVVSPPGGPTIVSAEIPCGW